MKYKICDKYVNNMSEYMRLMGDNVVTTTRILNKHNRRMNRLSVSCTCANVSVLLLLGLVAANYADIIHLRAEIKALKEKEGEHKCDA